MLKLNEDYSDYVDMTDENYPEGKAINASTSESFDGTPLLADFMNDMIGSKQAMYKKAYGDTSGISGSADSVTSSQFADAVAKYADDKDTAHADLRGTSAHGATVEATAGQLMTRDAYGNTQVGDPINDADCANKGYVDDHIEKTGTNAHGGTTAATADQIMVRDSSGKAYGKTSASSANPTLSKTDELVNFTALYNALFPVGFVYTQYPGQKSPSDMKMPGTWTEIKFGGAFFRSVGGNAKSFTSSFACSVSGDGLTVTFTSKPTSSQLAAGDILIYDSQYRTVSSYNASTGVAVVSSAFTNPTNITTVIIGQSDLIKAHTHNADYVSCGNGTTYVIAAGGDYGMRGLATLSTKSTGGTESRPCNLTVKVWKRTA